MKKLVSLTVAISDTSVSTALVVRQCERKQDPMTVKPVIVTYRTKAFNPEHKDITSDYLQDRLSVLLKSIIKETRYEDVVKAKLSVKDIKRINVSLSAPWFEGKTVTSHFNEAKPFKITSTILDKALDSEVKAVSGLDKTFINILESNILSATINGYTINDPIGKTASTLTVSGYVSYTKTSTYNLIKETLDDHFHHVDEISIKSEPTLLLSAALQEVEKTQVQGDFAVIRVNEILTHIQIIRNKHIKELGTIPIGLNTLLKDIAETCGVTPEVALNVLDLHTQGRLEAKFSQTLKSVTAKVLERWRIGIKEFSSSTLDSGRFPTHVFLSSATVLSAALKEHIVSDDYLDLTMSDQHLSVEILDRETLDAFLETNPTITVEPGFLTKLNALV